MKTKPNNTRIVLTTILIFVIGVFIISLMGCTTVPPIQPFPNPPSVLMDPPSELNTLKK